MARGIERREIFKDDKDRKSFLDRLADILEETQTQCYAWSLMPNHLHLLLRIGPTPAKYNHAPAYDRIRCYLQRTS